MPLGRFVAAVVVATAGAILALVLLFPESEDFRTDNPFWNGLQQVTREHRVVPLDSLDAMPTGLGPTSLLLVPSRPPGEGTVTLVGEYLRSGGNVILADDFSYGNLVLEGLGVPFRFNGGALVDPLFNLGNRWLPLATQVQETPVTRGVSTLALNYATAIEPTGLTVLAESSSFSFLDLDGDGVQDPDEPSGPLPVLGYAQVGGGNLFVLSDPSVFINTMLPRKDNARFASQLLTGGGPDVVVLVDVGLLPASNLARTRGLLAGVRRGLQRPQVMIALAALMTAGFLYPIWRERKGTVESE